MKLPLLLLSVGAVIAGLVPFGNYVSSDGTPLHIHLHIGDAVLPVLIALTVIGIATYFYKTKSSR